MSPTAGQHTEAIALSHSARLSLFAAERKFQLEADRLAWSDARGTGSVAYADVVQVRVLSYRNLSGPLFWQCVIKDRSGRRTMLSSQHYVRLGTFENRMTTYAPLIRELLLRVAAANPAARFIQGPMRVARFFWFLILVADLFVIAFMVIIAITGELPLKSIPFVMIVLLLTPRAWHEVRRGWPHPLDPSNPPAGFLAE